MAKIYCEKTEPFSASQLFLLVNDISSYDQFVPGCKKAGIVKNNDDLIHAYIMIEKLGFSKRFSTENRLNFPNSIEMSLIDGPFKTLYGQWRFSDLNHQQGKIELSLEFEMSSKLLALTFTPVFNELMHHMVDSFSLRAKKVYNSYEILTYQ